MVAGCLKKLGLLRVLLIKDLMEYLLGRWGKGGRDDIVEAAAKLVPSMVDIAWLLNITQLKIIHDAG